MSDKARFVAAAKRYGPALDGVARKYGLTGAELLLKLGKGESGFRQSAVSKAGARGATQFMPGTRASFIKQYGVDPWKDVDSAVHAAQIYLKRSGLAAYNPGMPSYTKYILGQDVGKVRGGGGGEVGGSVTTRTAGYVHTDKLAALRAALLSGSKNPLIDAARAAASGQYDTQVPGKTKKTYFGSAAASGGKATLAGGADRPGVKTSPSVLAFVRQVAAQAGVRSLTIGTGTNHTRMTVDGNVSDHWSGHAADIPATGAHLIHLGQAALIAAGMSPAKARQQRGGLYNIGGHQIIFNTYQGGNHTNHLHVSAH